MKNSRNRFDLSKNMFSWRFWSPAAAEAVCCENLRNDSADAEWVFLNCSPVLQRASSAWRVWVEVWGLQLMHWLLIHTSCFLMFKVFLKGGGGHSVLESGRSDWQFIQTGRPPTTTTNPHTHTYLSIVTSKLQPETDCMSSCAAEPGCWGRGHVHPCVEMG